MDRTEFQIVFFFFSTTLFYKLKLHYHFLNTKILLFEKQKLQKIFHLKTRPTILSSISPQVSPTPQLLGMLLQDFLWDFMTLQYIVTARKRSLGQGNMFRSLSLSTGRMPSPWGLWFWGAVWSQGVPGPGGVPGPMGGLVLGGAWSEGGLIPGGT